MDVNEYKDKDGERNEYMNNTVERSRPPLKERNFCLSLRMRREEKM